jgi:protein O-GlcNAc transferase
MWMRTESAMAEMLPTRLELKGFRNLAGLVGLDYFSVHGSRQQSTRKKGGGWQSDDVGLEKEKFVELVESAVRSMYKKGLRD